MNYISLDKCNDRQAYIIKSRNLECGVFKKNSGGFIGLRAKFGEVFLSEEFHYDKGPPYGTVKPLEALHNLLPENVELCRDLGSICMNCLVNCEYMPLAQPTELRGKWQHLADTVCINLRPVIRHNLILFGWLKELESKYKVKHGG